MKTLVNQLISLLAIMTLAVVFTACGDDDSPGLPPSFTMAASAEVQAGEELVISITDISTPGGYSDMTATVTSGGGTATFTAKPAADATSGSATMIFTASAATGVTTIDVSIIDNALQITNKTIAITVTGAPVQTAYEIAGITEMTSDEFTLSKSTKNGQDVIRLIGNINRSITFGDLTDFEWLISGSTFVVGDATLTIDEGVTVYFDAESSATSLIAVQQGSKIDAEGTAANPIVLTSSNKLSGSTTSPDGGDWGGLVLNGRAGINIGSSAEGEGGSGTYGGSDDADNSGTLRYIRLEYAGRVIGVDNELNGFSFNGVGSATTIEYIQSYFGEDDGIEFFGGTANVKWAVSTASRDDSFDWTHGWRGNGQFWVVEQIAGRGDRGFEADNLGDDNAATPFSEPTIANITLIGSDGNGGGNNTTGMRLREGTKGKLHNAIVTGFESRGVRVTDTQTEANFTDGSLILTNSIVFDNDDNVRNFDGVATGWASTNSNTTDGSAVSLSGAVGVVAAGALDPTTLNAWFTAATFVGAVDPNNNWLTGWALKKDGTIY